ncbi:hypothetical protein PPL_05176 [Heterostelium album PN500]|uniref:Uncharacterized protein n=1 Tax=Heterostelium pallidum (strain ATCC 26659 / Pp 5 / PN500) TaxID=670386 RepID=D3B9N0_HETP5|nr:hypothetical protein PPL_05176 [Heterostelium album PN500]EFA81942.1 hypothetical protein PPL_05176 [Heterostelium album PN500]|eukprot:XP_020434059.1 hypothetical protein PPL_05176 [Heterostelium album PN500]
MNVLCIIIFIQMEHAISSFSNLSMNYSMIKNTRNVPLPNFDEYQQDYQTPICPGAPIKKYVPIERRGTASSQSVNSGSNISDNNIISETSGLVLFQDISFIGKNPSNYVPPLYTVIPIRFKFTRYCRAIDSDSLGDRISDCEVKLEQVKPVDDSNQFIQVPGEGTSIISEHEQLDSFERLVVLG